MWDRAGWGTAKLFLEFPTVGDLISGLRRWTHPVVLTAHSLFCPQIENTLIISGNCEDYFRIYRSSLPFLPILSTIFNFVST